MGVFNALEIGKRALLAQRFGLDVTSNNIANVNTPGYSRQTALLQETEPLPTNGGLLGTGVTIAKVDSARQEFFDREIRSSISSLAGYNTDTEVVQRLESLFAESSEYSLDASIREFFSAFADLSLRPESIDKRKLVLNSAEKLVNHFQAIGQDMEDLRFDIKNRANDAVGQINRILGEIAELNRKVTTARAQGDSTASQIGDRRSVLLEELAEFVNVRVSLDSNNIASVSIGGDTVVAGTTYSNLELRESIDSVSSERTLSLVSVDPQGNVRTTYNPTVGELSSLLKHYNITLDGNDSSSGYSIVGEFNSLADALVENVNALHSTGFGLDDTGTTSPGRSFFESATVTSPVTALNISLSSDVIDQPRNIATAALTGEPGNNTIARQIADLIEDQNFINGSTVIEFYSGIITETGNLGNGARNGAATVEIIQTQLTSQREAINGVSLDEEAISLIKFQRAFEASARVISTANELLGVVVNLGT